MLSPEVEQHKARQLRIQQDSQQLEQSQEDRAMKARLSQMYSSYQRGQWADVAEQCAAITAYCRQKMASQKMTSQTTTSQQTMRQRAIKSGRQGRVSGALPLPAERSAPHHSSSQSSNTPVAGISAASPNQPNDDQAAAEAKLHLAKGDLFEKQGDIIRAIESYEQVLALQTQHKDLLKKIGSLYVEQTRQLKATGDVAGAARVYLQALEKHPRLFVAYNRLRYNLMRYDIAAHAPVLNEIVAGCQKIVEQQPELLPAQITLAYALTKLGKREDAIATYRRASELFSRRQIEKKSADVDTASLSFSPQQSKPQFMIIGAEKSGTTSLYQYLRQHPDVLPSIEKEIDFFDMEYEQGVDWYLAHFPPVIQSSTSQQWITGETSANYLYSDTAPERMFEHFPDIKLAAILRNPIDRTVSRYSMMVRNGAEHRTLAEAVDEEISTIQDAVNRSADEQTIPWSVLNRCRHVGNSLYFYHLQRWLSLFPKEQLVVLKSEDLFSQPEQTLFKLYQEFGLSAHTIEDYPKHNSGSYTPAEEEVRETLSAFFAPHTQKLEALLDRSFNWSL